MSHRSFTQSISRGFTLIELAVVLTIIALLVAATAAPLAQQISEQRNIETQTRLNNAVNALIGFAVLNRRLPCPDIDIGTAADRNGFEKTDAALGCAAGLDPLSPNTGDVPTTTTVAPAMPIASAVAVSWGELPWATLGLSGSDTTDAWNNRIRYAVYVPLTSTTVAMPNAVGLANLNNSNLVVTCRNTLTGTSAIAGCPTNNGTALASNVSFIVYSHGANGFGARGLDNAAATQFPAGLPATNDQFGNFPNAETTQLLRNQFVAHVRTNNQSNVGEFDDLLVWISSNTLAAKLLAAGVWP